MWKKVHGNLKQATYSGIVVGDNVSTALMYICHWYLLIFAGIVWNAKKKKKKPRQQQDTSSWWIDNIKVNGNVTVHNCNKDEHDYDLHCDPFFLRTTNTEKSEADNVRHGQIQ